MINKEYFRYCFIICWYREDAKRQLHKEIELMKGLHNKRPVVVVDEARLLDREMLEEVRFLLNF